MAGDVRWHLNPETGKPGRCSAKKQCRFGIDADEHASTFEEAQSLYEEKMKEQQFPTLEKERKGVQEVPPVEAFTRRIPAEAPLSHYLEEGDYLKHRDEIIHVRSFAYERALLAYAVEDYEGNTHYIRDDDWYHSSTLSVVDKRPPADPEAFEVQRDSATLGHQERFTLPDSDEVYTLTRREAVDYSYEPHDLLHVEEQEEPLKVYWHERDPSEAVWNDKPHPTYVFTEGE